MHSLLFILCIIISSCSVGPDYEEPQIYEDAQISQALKLNNNNLQIPQDWYKQFNDKTLDNLIKQALENNASVEQAAAKLRQARAVAAINKTEYLPMLNSQAGYNYEKASKNIGLAADSNFFQLGLDASWEIDIWGAGRRLNEQSFAQLQEASYSLRNVKVMIVAETANTYFLLKTALAQLQIAKNNLKLQQDIYKTVQEKYDAGLADDAALNQAKYVISTTQASVYPLEYQVEAYKNALAVLAGTLPDQLPKGLTSFSNNPVKKAAEYNMKTLYNLPADIIRTRPDVRAAERALAAQNAAIGQAVAQLYPNVTISGLFGFQSAAGSKLFNTQSQAYSYSPSITLPLFNWNKLQNNVKLQKYIKHEALANYRQTILSAVEELGNAMVSVQKEYAANDSQRKAVQQMRQTLQSMRQKYENGLIDFSQLLQTEQNLLTAENALAASNGNLYQNIIAFYKATGGGYN